MRRLVLGALALLLLPLTAATTRAAAADPVRILVYGDSITQGSTGDYTWRYFLDRHLRGTGVPFDMVGPRSGLHHVPDAGPDDSEYAAPAFDSDHAAVWGQALTTPTDDLGDLAATYRPDVIVALIGINDLVWQGISPAAMADEWRAAIGRVRASSPRARVVLVQVPQTWYTGVPAYDDTLVSLATELDEPTARVVATDLPAFDQQVDTWDGTHPTASGDLKIAVAVEKALARIGVALPPGMVPAVANGPRRAATLTATPGIGEVELGWQDVAGVTREWLERRDATAGGDWDRYPYPFSAGTVGWTAGGLTDGHRYEFRLRPAKGSALSVDVTSPVVSAIPGRRPPAPAPRVTADAGGRLQASWAPSPGATSYVVQLRDATGAWRTVERTPDPASQVTGLVNGRRYEIRVRADDGLIEGGTSPSVAALVPLLAPVHGVRARSPRRHRVRTTAATVPFATGYRVAVAAARSCARPPRASAFRAVRPDLRRPAATLPARSRAVWVRWYAVRGGVVGAGSPASCTRVR